MSQHETVRILADTILEGVAHRRCPKCNKMRSLDEIGLRRMAKKGENNSDLITNQSWCRKCR